MFSGKLTKTTYGDGVGVIGEYCSEWVIPLPPPPPPPPPGPPGPPPPGPPPPPDSGGGGGPDECPEMILDKFYVAKAGPDVDGETTIQLHCYAQWKPANTTVATWDRGCCPDLSCMPFQVNCK